MSLPLLFQTGLTSLLGLLLIGAGDEPVGPPAPSDLARASEREASGSPVFVILEQDGGVGPLLDRLRRPDFVVLDGQRYDELTAAARRAAGGATEPEGPTIESVTVRGELAGELAALEVEYVVVLLDETEARVPLRLDEGQVIASVAEGDRELLPRSENGVWFVEVQGKGRHRVTVRLPVPIQSIPDGKRLELAIPEAAATRLDLTFDRAITDARLDGEELTGIVTSEDSDLTRARVSLTPRSRLELTWRSGPSDDLGGPALLSAHGNLSVDIEPGGLRIAGSYEIRAERGSAKSLAFQLDPADELISAELDGQPIRSDPDGNGQDYEFELTEAIRPGTSRKLTIVARRPLPVVGPSRVVLHGFPLRGVAMQSGLIAIAQSGELWVGGTPGEDLRQVDPRSELPPALRVRPSNVLAYQFLDQPFELELQIDPSPPWVRVVSRATVALSSREARVHARLDYQLSRGREFEVRVAIPEGLMLDSVGPERWVASFEALARSPDAEGDGPRVLSVTLTDAARQAGTFELELNGVQRIDPTGRVEVGMFRPINATAWSGHLALLTARDVTVELDDESHFVPAVDSLPADWSWPESRTSGEVVPDLWLHDDGQSAALPLRVTVHPRSLRHQTTLDAFIDRRRIEVRQDTVIRVDYGTLSRLTVAVPESIEGRWELEGVEISRREPLGPGQDGASLYRLVLSRDVADQVHLRFRIRIDPGEWLAKGKPGRVVIAGIRPLEGEAEPPLVRVAADPGIRLVPEGDGWIAADAVDPVAPGAREDTPLRLLRSGPEAAESPAVLLASAHELAALPPLVASRLWFRTIRSAEGRVKATATYRLEAHRSEMSFALPKGVEPSLVRVGDLVVSEVEKLPESEGFRLRFPASAPRGPVTVHLEYDLDADAGSPWGAPRLLRGGVVQQTYWELRLPWQETLVGVPPGWSDQNRWAWNVVYWSRRPIHDPAELAAWVEGAGADAGEAGPGTSRVSGDLSHSVLFSRPGEPVDLRPWIVSRAVLVAGCSGGTLLIGLALLIWRPRGRAVGLIALATVVALATAWHPSVLMLLGQSAFLGIILTILAGATQRFVEHRFHHAARGFQESSDSSPSPRPTPAQGSSRSSQVRTPTPDGPEGSTIIRPRPGSTTSHVEPVRLGNDDEPPGFEEGGSS